VPNRIEQRQPALARRLSSWPDKLQEVPLPAPFMIGHHPSDQRFRGAGAIHDFEMPDAQRAITVQVLRANEVRTDEVHRAHPLLFAAPADDRE
jgi:hypothetical protein